jgi:hypothetical protein
MNKKWLPVIVVGLTLAVVIALFSPLASSHPDGLERVAEDNEFLDKANDNPYEIIPDYTFPGINNEEVATIVSGIIGVAIVAGLGFGLAFAMRTISKKSGPSDSGATSRGATST